MSITTGKSTIEFIAVNDFETELGQLLQKHESQGTENLLDGLDYYVVLLETKRDQSLASEEKKN